MSFEAIAFLDTESVEMTNKRWSEKGNWHKTTWCPVFATNQLTHSLSYPCTGRVRGLYT